MAILFEPSPEMIVALLGVLKSGAAYLPLDAEMPRGRLEYMLSDARSRSGAQSGIIAHGNPGNGEAADGGRA